MKKILLMVVALGMTFSAAAQEYPAKAIRFVVPYPPGGASDITARVLGQKMNDAWNQQVVVDNRPGANGIIALEYVAKAAPDGYTILMANLGPNAINPGVYSKLPYDAVKSFAPVTLTTIVPQIIVANAYLPANNVRQLVALAKAKPGELTYGTGGNGSANHLAMELLASMAGVRMTMIAYKGDAPAMTDAVAGQVMLALPTVLAAMPFLNSGKLKAIAVTPKKRVAALPNVPTVAESGVPGLADYESVSWGGVMAPAGTPAPVVQKLNAELVRILKLPDVRERMTGLGADIVAGSPQEFAAYLQEEIAKWGKVARQAGVKLD
ncbi:MAG: Bug family tripartite tricarboxylate transporter substrate binding protein [Burkholderiales bacterium]